MPQGALHLKSNTSDLLTILHPTSLQLTLSSVTVVPFAIDPSKSRFGLQITPQAGHWAPDMAFLGLLNHIR